MYSFRSKIVVLLSLVAGFAGAQNSQNIQPNGNSPYSRFGLGDPVNQSYAALTGLGGIGASFYDPYHLNTVNPASLGHLQSTAFEVGFFGKYANLKGLNTSSDIWSGNLNYLALGFPLINPIGKALNKSKSPWEVGMSFSLQPYTTVNYNVESKEEQGELGLVSSIFKGTGGTYRLLWGTGVKYKNLSLGANLGYLFGKISNNRRIEFDSIEVSYSTEFLDEISINGFVWNLGAQYTWELDKQNPNKTNLYPRRLIIGATAHSSNSFTTNSSRFYQRNSFSYGVIDTLIDEKGLKRSGTLPSEWTLGLMYEKVNKFKIGAEYSQSHWSEYENEVKPENLSDSKRLAVGMELIPEFNAYDSYLRRARYRLGFVYATDPRSFESDQIEEYIVTIGIGFPIIMPRQQISFINLSVEAGQFGISDAIQENFVKMTVGFTLNDNTWFFKRKFN